MITVSLVVVAVLYTLADVYYIKPIVQREHGIAPKLSTWLMFTIATLLNVVSFLAATERKAWLAGMLGVIDFFECFAVVVALLSVHGGFVFERFERRYLKCAAAIVVFWVASRSFLSSRHGASVANILSQALITCGYFPTIQKLKNERTRTEPLLPWWLCLAGAAVSLYPAWAIRSPLAFIYGARAVVLTSLMLRLIHTYKGHADTSQPSTSPQHTVKS